MPIKNKSGVIKNPPPTPNIPDRIPTIPPNPSSKNAFTDTSAMGRYTCMASPYACNGIKFNGQFDAINKTRNLTV
jgi:hypothetical protein